MLLKRRAGLTTEYEGHYPGDRKGHHPWMLYRGFNREAGRDFTLNNTKEEVPKVGLEDKIVGAGKDMTELEQQARVPRKTSLQYCFSLKGGGNGV
jgi:hypothetical protein